MMTNYGDFKVCAADLLLRIGRKSVTVSMDTHSHTYLHTCLHTNIRSASTLIMSFRRKNEAKINKINDEISDLID